MSTHTLSVDLENRPGALARVAALFARRAFNIDSLAVGPTEDPAVFQITLTVDCDAHALEQIEKQMLKLVNVLSVSLLGPEAATRELALITLTPRSGDWAPARVAGARAGARVTSAGPALCFELTAAPGEVDAFERLIRQYGVVRLIRSGPIALPLPRVRAATRRPDAPSPKGHAWPRSIATAQSSS